MGKLWSMGRVARDVSHALRENLVVIPYTQSDGEPNQRENLISFLKSIDILWADLYPSSTYALNLRDELSLTCPAILFAGGAMPKGAEAMLFPWQPLLRPYDGILFSCKADQDIWRRLTEWNKLKEWVIPLSIDEQIFYPRSDDERVAIRNKYRIPNNSPLLLYVGRVNIQKNIHALLKVLNSVSEEIPDVHLCIVGEEDDIVLGEFKVRNTNYKEWLLQKAEELGLTERIRYVGPLFGEELAQM
jgi:glycosyltransferase involved in cell wall biosynthesis